MNPCPQPLQQRNGWRDFLGSFLLYSWLHHNMPPDLHKPVYIKLLFCLWREVTHYKIFHKQNIYVGLLCGVHVLARCFVHFLFECLSTNHVWQYVVFACTFLMFCAFPFWMFILYTSHVLSLAPFFFKSVFAKYLYIKKSCITLS